MKKETNAFLAIFVFLLLSCTPAFDERYTLISAEGSALPATFFTFTDAIGGTLQVSEGEIVLYSGGTYENRLVILGYDGEGNFSSRLVWRDRGEYLEGNDGLSFTSIYVEGIAFQGSIVSDRLIVEQDVSFATGTEAPATFEYRL